MPEPVIAHPYCAEVLIIDSIEEPQKFLLRVKRNPQKFLLWVKRNPQKVS